MANTPFKMKGSPMQRNFGIGSPVKDKYVSSKELIAESGKQEKKKKPTLGEWWKGTKLGKDLKALGTKMQDTAANIQHSTPESRSKTVRKGFETASTKRSEASEKRSTTVSKGFSKASEKRSKASKKRSEQIKKLKNRLFVPRKKKSKTITSDLHEKTHKEIK